MTYINIFDRYPVLVNYGPRFSIFGLLLTAFRIYVKWVVLEKAGERGWKCLIPFYSTYIEYKLYWNPLVFWLMFLSPVFILVSFAWAYNYSSFVAATICVISSLLFAICEFILQIKKGKCFDQGGAFGIGLFFLNLIFSAILCFDSKCQYVRNEN